MSVPENKVTSNENGRRLESFEILDSLQINDMVQIDLIDYSDSDLPENKSFKWNITTYSNYTMNIQLIFEDPLQISASQNDEIKVTFNDTRFIYDFAGQEVNNGTQLIMAIPPQYSSNIEAEIFESFVETFETYETGSFSSDIAVNAVVAGTLNHVWSIIRS